MLNLTEERLREIVLRGAGNAAVEYHSWSNGYSVTEYGTEHVINVNIAKWINQFFGADYVAVVLEETYDGLSEYTSSGADLEDIADEIRARGRIDIAVYDRSSGDDEIFALIETKRKSPPSEAEADIKRIAAYVEKFDHQSGGKLNFGYFVTLEHYFVRDKGDVEEFKSDRLSKFKSFCPTMCITAYHEFYKEIQFEGEKERRVIVPILFRIEREMV